MSEELKQFFEDIKDTQDSFLFWRLYNNPYSVIGNDQNNKESELELFYEEDEFEDDPVEVELRNSYDYCRLMMNNNLTKFIRLVLPDEDFAIKSDYNIWVKFALLIDDSIEFKEYYHINDDADLLQLFKEEITTNEYFKRIGDKRPPVPIYTGYNIYKKYHRLYDWNYPNEQIKNYDEKNSHNVGKLISIHIDVLRQQTIEKERNKRIALKWIEEDDYSDKSNLDNTYLYRYQLFSGFVEPYSLIPGLSIEVLDNLVCENKFLDIIEHKIDEGTIDGLPLENALNIIIFGINIKKGKVKNLQLLVNRLGIDLVKNFDWHRAEKLVSKITIYKIRKNRQLGKILQFRSENINNFKK